MSDQKLAFLWHLIEAIMIVLLALSLIGLGWSIRHLHPKQPLVECRRPAQ